MRRLSICLTALCVFTTLAAQETEKPSLLGFTPASAQAELELEKRFQAIPDPDRMRANMQRLTARPHHVGSPYDKRTPSGSSPVQGMGPGCAHRRHSRCCFPRQKRACSSWSAPTKFTAKLEEPARRVGSHLKPERRAAAHLQRLLHRWRRHRAPRLRELRHAPTTTKSSSAMGVSVKGAIVIARYGRILARHQAQGCGGTWRHRLHHLFRSGRRRLRAGDVFPDGPMRPADGVQRGSVMDMPVYPGDPLTPGVGATDEAKRARSRMRRPSPRFPCCPSPMPTRSRCWLA